MTATIINLDDERLLRTYDRVGREIIEYINNMDLSWEVEIARRIYFGKHIDAASLKSMNMSYKPFIQWLIFSYKIHNGYSLIDCVYDTCIHNINKYEKDALVGLKNTYESLYKVYSVEGDKILVKDIFSKESIYIWDNLLAKNVKRYCGIFARITSINSKSIAIPGYSVMTNSFLKSAEQYITRKFNEYNKFDKYTSIHNFINKNSLMIHRYFLDYEI